MKNIFILLVFILSFSYGDKNETSEVDKRYKIFSDTQVVYQYSLNKVIAVTYDCMYSKIHNGRHHTPFDGNNTRVLNDIINDLNKLDELTSSAIFFVCSKPEVGSEIKAKLEEDTLKHNNALISLLNVLQKDKQKIETMTSVLWIMIVKLKLGPGSAKKILKDFEIKNNLLEKFPID